jgi:hypothetical protein
MTSSTFPRSAASASVLGRMNRSAAAAVMSATKPIPSNARVARYA